jgi:hypothetical protein
MTEHEHDRLADELDREAADMEHRADELDEEIDEARDDWERKKRDSGVPGAAGAPERADEGPEPETSYPAKGDDE